MTSHLESLSVGLLRKILVFAANDTKTLLRCELTCHTVAQVVQDDKTWKVLANKSRWRGDYRLNSNRLKASVETAFRSVRKEQKGLDNILVEELGVTLWNDLVSTISRLVVPLTPYHGIRPDELGPYRFHFRGDTLHVLAELVQSYIVTFLSRANYCVCCDDHNRFPVLSLRQLKFQQDIGMGDLTYGIRPSDMLSRVMGEASALVHMADPALKDRLVRRLSRRAGVVRMESAAFDGAWRALFDLIFHMIHPACIKSIDRCERPTCGQVKRHLSSGETIRMVPPLPKIINGGWYVLHTLVPKQIEDAAPSVVVGYLPHKVYGETWLVPESSRQENESWSDALERIKADAEACYEFGDEDDHTNDLMEGVEIYDSDGEIMCIADELSSDDSEDEVVGAM